MIKLSFFFFVSFFALAGYGQLATNVTWTQQTNMPAKEVIYYDAGKQLSWDDFLGRPPKDPGITAALTVSGFGYNANIKTTNGKGVLNVTVYCYFNKNKSWVKPGKNTDYILTHEQHHFDISYLAAAIFIDKLQSTKFTTSNYNELLPRLYNESSDIMSKMQNDYDGETRNGQEKDQQIKWNAFIDKRVGSATK